MNISKVESSFQELMINSCDQEEARIYAKTVSKAEADQTSAKEDIIPYLDWKELYYRTASIMTPRLELAHPKLSDEECLFVNRLNEEFRSGKSHWTVLEVPKFTPNEIIKNLLKITINGGDFFTRLWFIKDRDTGQFIGILQSSRLDNHGLSEIDQQLSLEYCSKGYGTQTKEALFSAYKPFANKKIQMPSLTEFKERITPELRAISEFYLDKHDADLFLREIQEVTEFTRYFSSEYLSQLPCEVRIVVELAIRPLGKSNRPETNQYRGLKSLALTQAAVKSLRKCKFNKVGEDKWVKYCT